MEVTAFDVSEDQRKKAPDGITLANNVLGALGDIGVSTSVDDFGTGYSSLSYLKRLPVSEIKIDQSFVIGMTKVEHDSTIVRTVIDLAHNLGMSVLAEGVEDRETLDLLRRLGCDRAQGYLVSRAVPSGQLPDTIDRWHIDAGVAQVAH